MSTRRLSIALLALGTLGTATSPSADACWLTDWLFGRTASPYSAGYAPYGAGYSPYTAGYAPQVGATQILTTPIGSNPYAANYPANYASGYTALPLQSPAQSSGVFQVQRPAYLNNPSVYTGLPTAANAQAAYSAPITSNYRGGSASSAGYFGAANTYPTSPYSSGMPINSSYSSPYASNFQSATSPGAPLTITSPSGSPATMLPTTQVTPLFPPQTQPVGGGLARFFGSLFGTNYNSSYYRAPVTYYRPVTSVDPMLGTTVTVQQPCTSSITQVQRTPYSSLLGTQPAPMYGQAPSDCQTQPGMYGAPTYSQASPYGPTYDPAGGISQAGAVGTSPGQFTVPIPSTAPPADYSYGAGGYGATSPSPLTGSPSAPRPQAGNGDLVPLEQPRLDAYRQSTAEPTLAPEQFYRPATPDYTPEPTSPPVSTQPREAAPKSYWQLQDADNSTAMIRPNPRPEVAPSDPISLSAPSFTAAEPIHAPEHEQSPFENRPTQSSGVSRANFDAPPLPPARNYSPADANSASSRSAWSGTPVREVALVRGETAAKPVAPQLKPQPKPEPPRDSRWFTVQP
ncbi:hypothetical protein Poly51_00490 [Rubripirellula tenax]|uniref:Uncharacterized protein n=1 Tax=Rubripirellula tenax TaxID=2528015 RepID=A0A5C6FHT9_9BACT|nr:hypothetical protein [Rubripirellula tenax]TWU59777.1 hypothetical protein Poly51_00490 [Rubripirellula tenax]